MNQNIRKNCSKLSENLRISSKVTIWKDFVVQRMKENKKIKWNQLKNFGEHKQKIKKAKGIDKFMQEKR